jgi:hypothetical protein
MQAVGYWRWRACWALYYPVAVRAVHVVQGGYTIIRTLMTRTIAAALAGIITITIDIVDQHVDPHVEDKDTRH